MDIPDDKRAEINSKLLQIATSGSFASASLASDLVYLLSGDHVKCPDCDGLGTVSSGKTCPRCCGKGYIPKVQNDEPLAKAR